VDTQHAGSAGGIATEVWQADLSEPERRRLADFLKEMADAPFLRCIAARSLEWMRLTAGNRALDVGCGSGVFLHVLARMVGPDGHVVGVDHAPALLREAGGIRPGFSPILGMSSPPPKATLRLPTRLRVEK